MSCKNPTLILNILFRLIYFTTRFSQLSFKVDFTNPYKLRDTCLVQSITRRTNPPFFTEHCTFAFVACCSSYLSDQLLSNSLSYSLHYLPLDGMINIPIYLVLGCWVQLDSFFFFLQIT